MKGRVDLPVAGIDVLPAQFRPNQISVKQILCPLAAVMSIALLLTSYMSVAGGDVEAYRIQSQLERVNLQLQEAKQAVASIQQVEAEVSRLEEEREAVLGTGGFADTLRLVVDAASPDIQLVSISQTEEGRINLSGTAESQQAVIVYAQALERSMGLSKPSISIEGTGPYSFKIMVSG
jgi:Tfp pilus assembly protein PilN